jgi:hypothetical protein
MTEARDQRARALDEWADRVDPSDLKEADPSASGAVAAFADQSEAVEIAGEGKGSS